MDLLRHGVMGVLSGGIRALSTLGSHVRSCTWRNVAQLDKGGRLFLAATSSCDCPKVGTANSSGRTSSARPADLPKTPLATRSLSGNGPPGRSAD
jgi:hypothetical protein